MDDFEFDPSFDLDQARAEWEALIQHAVAQVLAHEDPQALMDWMGEHGPSLNPTSVPEGSDPDRVRRTYRLLARRIWDATPLPSNRFQPRPLPEPRRDAPCVCGDDARFEHCCHATWKDTPPIDPDMIWPVLLDQLPQAVIDQAVARRQIPPPVLAELADRHIEDGAPERALALLEDLFVGPLQDLDQRHNLALLRLADAYDALGRHQDKLSLLRRVAEEGAAVVAADAWQRLATIYMDQGDYEQARQALETARRKNPDDPALALLEVTLLLEEGRPAQAQDRARFWLARLRRLDNAEPEFLEFLAAVAADPGRAMTALYAQASRDQVVRLQAWLEQVRDRPAPAYRLTEPESADAQDTRAEIADRLRAVGAELDEALLDDMVDELEQMISGPVGVGIGGERPSRALQAPAQVAELDQAWREVYPWDKPLSLMGASTEGEDPWEEEAAGLWLSFLEHNPAAFDSLDILDDLATAARALGMDELTWTAQALLEPLAQRAEAVLEQTLAQQPAPVRLSWLIESNRPLLRLLLMGLAGASDWAAPAAEPRVRQLLALDPHDHHNLRGRYINALLQAGRDADALALADAYPDDALVDVSYGRALALYRLDRRQQADAQLRAALEAGPEVAIYLPPEEATPPEEDEDLPFQGDEEEAWYYREVMRPAWKATEGALQWLRSAADAD